MDWQRTLRLYRERHPRQCGQRCVHLCGHGHFFNPFQFQQFAGFCEGWTTISTAHKLSLSAGTYTLCETEAPKGYEVAADIEFQVTSDGKLLIDKKAVDTLTLTMTDKKKQTSTPTPVVTPTPTPVETPAPTATPAAPKPATTIPRTADDYPLIPLAIAFVASGAALGLGLGKKRRHHS